MTRVLLLFVFAVAPAIAQSPPEGQRVFVCAHSFMIFTARQMPAIAESAKIKHVAAGQSMIGGSRTIQHWNLPDDKNPAKKALQEGKVDVFVCSPLAQLPDEGIDNFTKLGLEKNPKLRVLVQASWIPRDGETGRDFKNEARDAITADKIKNLREIQDGFNKQLVKQVEAINKTHERHVADIIPVGDAVLNLREKILDGKAPGLAKHTDLFRDALGHGTPILEVFVTYCHYAAIYKASPVGLPVPKAIEKREKATELNKLLQTVAWDTVSGYPHSGVKK